MKTKRLIGQAANLSLRLSVFISLFVISCGGNSAKAAKMHFGLQASPELSWIKPNFAGAKFDGLTFGYKYGLYTAYDFTEHYSLSTGVQISNRGGKFSFSDGIGIVPTSTDIHHQIQYLDIPLSLKMTTTEIGYITYYGEFGVLPSFRLKARSDVENFVAGVSMNKTENINSVKDINPITLALHIGLGMQYSLSESTSLLMGLYINNGFTDILHDTETIKFKANANQAGLTVGFLF